MDTSAVTQTNITLEEDKAKTMDSFIKRACNAGEGALRKNIPKFLIRELLKFLLNYPGRVLEKINKVINIDTIEFNKIIGLCNELMEKEKIRKGEGVKKDYVKLINGLVQNPIYHYIFHLNLESILERFRAKNYGRIGKVNREIYHTTVQADWKSTRLNSSHSGESRLPSLTGPKK